LSSLAAAAAVAAGLFSGLAACGPPMERTPQTAGRNDAMVAHADAPVWKPGDVWRYRGKTFDSKDNRFHERVLRAFDDSGKAAYEVDTPEYLTVVDGRTLRPVRRRRKETGEVAPAISYNPLFFPLDFSTRFSMNGTRVHEGEKLPYSVNCRVVNYEDIEVHAGKFAAFRIDCETNDGFAESWYAPAVKNLVRMRWMAARDSFSAELWDYDLAP
jgi:hypothetical protein